MNKLRLLFRRIVPIVFLFLPLISFAQQYENKELIPGQIRSVNGGGTSDFVTYLENLYGFGIGIAAILAIFMIAVGAFIYIFTSAGNVSKTLDAKETIKNALTGLVLALTAYLLLFIINPDLVGGTLNGPGEVLQKLVNKPSGYVSAVPDPSIIPDPPIIPDLPTPVSSLQPNNTEVEAVNNKITLTWDEVAEAEKYAIRVDDKESSGNNNIESDGEISLLENLKNLVAVKVLGVSTSANDESHCKYKICDDGITGTSYEVEVEVGKEYHWWIHSIKGNDWSEASEASFTVKESSLFVDEMSVSSLFSDNMVLQQKQKIHIWGKAKNDEKVTVMIGEKIAEATAKNNRWDIYMDPIEAGGPYDMTIESISNKIVIRNILVGEVWLCSGQSNMTMSVSETDNFEKSKSGYIDSRIRVFKQADSFSRDPLDEVLDGKWIESNKNTIGYFTAIGYYFADDIIKELDVPVGIISAGRGGTRIESWMPKEDLLSDPELKDIYSGEYDKQDINIHKSPSIYYNSMISPFVDYPIKGVLWYQGEGNANDYPNRYEKLFNIMTSSWRQKWNIGNFPFYYVQLPGLAGKKGWPVFRETQRDILSSVENTGMAVAIDVGDRDKIHPPNKKIVSERLSRVALAKTYGKNVLYRGPTLKDVNISKTEVILTFENVGEGLLLNGSTLNGFEISTDGKNFISASANISGKDKVVISIPDGKIPVNIRYLFTQFPEEVNLYDSDMLPAAPFRVEVKSSEEKSPAIGEVVGGSNYVMIDIGDYAETCKWNSKNITPVIGKYHLNKEKVREQLKSMYDNGQRSISLFFWYSDEGNFNDGIQAHVIQMINGEAPFQQKENIKNLINDIKETGFERVVFRFGMQNSTRPQTWTSWNEPLYQDILNLILDTRKVVNGAWCNNENNCYGEGLLFDLSVERGGSKKGQDSIFTRRLWDDYVSKFGKTDTFGFSTISNVKALGSYDVAYAIENYDLTEAGQPNLYAFDIYNNGDVYSGFIYSDKVLKDNNIDSPIIIMETYYNDLENKEGFLRAINETGRRVITLYQWPMTEDSKCKNLSVPYPADYSNYLSQ